MKLYEGVKWDNITLQLAESETFRCSGVGLLRDVAKPPLSCRDAITRGQHQQQFIRTASEVTADWQEIMRRLQLRFNFDSTAIWRRYDR